MRGRRLLTGILATALVTAGISATPAHAAGGPNLAQGKSATASGVNGPYGAGNVTDGNAASYWESPNNAFPQWVRVDLGRSVAIDQVKLKLPPPAEWATRTQTLSVQGSTDNSAWSTLSASAARTFNPASGNVVTIDFSAASARLA